jgi:hypothetical protein
MLIGLVWPGLAQLPQSQCADDRRSEQECCHKTRTTFIRLAEKPPGEVVLGKSAVTQSPQAGRRAIVSLTYRTAFRVGSRRYSPVGTSLIPRFESGRGLFSYSLQAFHTFE